MNPRDTSAAFINIETNLKSQFFVPEKRTNILYVLRTRKSFPFCTVGTLGTLGKLPYVERSWLHFTETRYLLVILVIRSD